MNRKIMLALLFGHLVTFPMQAMERDVPQHNKKNPTTTGRKDFLTIDVMYKITTSIKQSDINRYFTADEVRALISDVCPPQILKSDKALQAIFHPDSLTQKFLLYNTDDLKSISQMFNFAFAPKKEATLPLAFEDDQYEVKAVEERLAQDQQRQDQEKQHQDQQRQDKAREEYLKFFQSQSQSQFHYNGQQSYPQQQQQYGNQSQSQSHYNGQQQYPQQQQQYGNQSQSQSHYNGHPQYPQQQQQYGNQSQSQSHYNEQQQQQYGNQSQSQSHYNGHPQYPDLNEFNQDFRQSQSQFHYNEQQQYNQQKYNDWLNSSQNQFFPKNTNESNQKEEINIATTMAYFNSIIEGGIPFIKMKIYSADTLLKKLNEAIQAILEYNTVVKDLSPQTASEKTYVVTFLITDAVGTLLDRNNKTLEILRTQLNAKKLPYFPCQNDYSFMDIAKADRTLGDISIWSTYLKSKIKSILDEVDFDKICPKLAILEIEDIGN